MKIARKLLFEFAPLLLTLLTASCSMAEERAEFHQTVALNADGSFQLSGVNGNVTVSGWDRQEVQIDAVKIARTREKLDEARIEVTGSGMSVNVRTRYPEHSNNSAIVNYTIHLPRGARLNEVATVNGTVRVENVNGLRVKASTVNGNVEASGVAGELQLNTVNGSVEARMSAAPHKDVRMETVNGSVSLRLPAASNAHVKASTVHGSIDTEMSLPVEHQRFTPGASLDSDLGSGGGSIELSTVNGSIHLGKS